MEIKWNRRILRALFIISLVSFCCSKAAAKIIRVPVDQPNIQLAINVAAFGDTVLVSPGVYRENINFMGKDIVVGSLLLTTGKKNYIAETVIQADSGSVVTFIRAKTKLAILTGFTITGGKGTKVDAGKDFVYGGGILILGASPAIKNNLITRNATGPSCFGRGGGIAIMDSANPFIAGNTISGNNILGPCTHTAYYGGGIWVDGTSNPIIGGSLSNANNIFSNSAVYGLQLYREGGGKVINAQFNYFGGRCPSDTFDPFEVWPQSQFDISNCSKTLVTKIDDDHTRFSTTGFQLLQNYPNPFNAATSIEFHLPHPGQVSLRIFNLHGEKVATLLDRKKFLAGNHKINWPAESLPSGVYFYHLLVNGLFSETRKLILLK